MYAYMWDHLFEAAIGVRGSYPSNPHVSEDLQNRLLIMELGNGPKQNWMISTPLLEGFVQFYQGTWLHMRGVYPLHM